MSETTVLVTGGAGYIGSHMCYALKKRGYRPVALDNLQNGHESAVQFGPLVKGDIGDSDLIRKICTAYKPKAVLHFAALIEVGQSVKQPDLYLDNNFRKAQRLMETLQECGVDKFIFSSTAAVYGMPGQKDAIAEDCPLNPINPYGESKLKAEQYLRSLANISSVSLRYFNAAGAMPEVKLGEAHQPETHLIPSALLTILGIKKEPLTIFGRDYPTLDGTAVRDYIHITDLTAAHIKALDYLSQGGGNQAINLGTGTGASVREILETIKNVTGKSVPTMEGPRRAGDPPFLVADNKRALEILQWRPERSLRQIIDSAWAWHQSADYQARIGEKAA